MQGTSHVAGKSCLSAGLFASAIALFGIAPAPVLAQGYPSQDIRLVCAFPPGSGADVVVRYFAEKLKPVTKRNVIVENRPGAGGNLAMAYVVKQKHDGHVIYLHTGSSMSANMHLYKKPLVDAGKDFQVAATINRQGFMMAVHANSKWKSVRELTAHLLQQGDKASYAASATSGTVMGEVYKALTGVKAVEVNYRMAQDSLNDLQSGRVAYGMLDPQFATAAMRNGQLRILGVATGERMQFLPEVPTMAESGVKGMDLVGWFAAFVATGTPKPVIVQINGWFKDILQQPETVKFLNQFGGDPWVTSHEEGQAYLLKDIVKWGEYIRIAKVPQRG